MNQSSIAPYIQNVLYEVRLIQDSLEKVGLRVTRRDCADVNFDLSSTKVALFRTIWDYFERHADFMTWLERVNDIISFINPRELVKWNLDKHYLLDLEIRGVNILGTLFIVVGEQASFAELVKSASLGEAILKPAFSTAARDT